METIKTVFVTGATGNQGGAVTKNLLNNGFKVKALTRDPSSIKTQKLKHPDVEIIKGDLNDIESYRNYLSDVDAVFSVQSSEDGIHVEIKQGKGLADMSKKFGVQHFLYSSVVGADLHTGIPNWESKWEIENHIKHLDLPYTILRPSSLFENFLIPQVKSRILKGKLVTPVNKEKVQQFIGADDIGKMSVHIFTEPGKYMNRTITLAAEQMDNEQVARIFSEVMGRTIKYQRLPRLITRLAMGKDLYKMFNWINQNDAVFIKDLDAFKKEYPSLESLKQWISRNFKRA
jgi:uncharacterized protein YbjT (DUF2867 family)